MGACGGHAGPGFAARADAICREQNRQLAALPSASTFALRRDNYDRGVAIVRRALRELERLDPPDALAPSLHGLIAAVDDELTAAEELRVASLSSDVESVQGGMFRLRKAARRALRQAHRLGLAACGRPLG